MGAHNVNQNSIGAVQHKSALVESYYILFFDEWIINDILKTMKFTILPTKIIINGNLAKAMYLSQIVAFMAFFLRIWCYSILLLYRCEMWELNNVNHINKTIKPTNSKISKKKVAAGNEWMHVWIVWKSPVDRKKKFNACYIHYCETQ